MESNLLNDIGYLINIRRNEVEVLTSLYGIDKIKGEIKVLEVGCGNTFSSAFLPKTRLLVCSDLPEPDIIHNKSNLAQVKKNSDSLGLENLKFIGCTALELPFKNETFDVVFSQYVLEHIKCQDKAIEEFKRVLKPGGLIISLVPNFIERFYEFPRYYLYLLKRLNSTLTRLFRAHTNNSLRPENDTLQERKVKLANFFEYYPHFPFIEPHGEYKNAVQEFIRHLPFNWTKLFKRHGMVIIDVFSTNYLPWNFLDVISYRLTDFLYQKSKYFTLKVGKLKVIKYLGYSLCVITSKRSKSI